MPTEIKRREKKLSKSNKRFEVKKVQQLAPGVINKDIKRNFFEILKNPTLKVKRRIGKMASSLFQVKTSIRK